MTTWDARSAVAGTVVAAIMVLASVAIPATFSPGSFGAPPSASEAAGPMARPEPLPMIAASPLVPVAGASADVALPNSSAVPVPANSTVPVLITLGVENSSRLSSLLAALEDPSSPQYHRYLTAAQFTSEFGPSAAEYDMVVDYLSSFGVASLTSHPDRLAVSFSASPGTLGRMLHTEIERRSIGGKEYWAAAASPTLPSSIADEVAGLDGVGPSSLPVAVPLAGVAAPDGPEADPAARTLAGTTSLAPVTIGSVQYLYPSDFQTAYDEESLFAVQGYPRSADVASLLWPGAYQGESSRPVCGTTLSSGEAVGAYDPADLSNFFANATPTGEPTASAVAVPIEGSPSPGCLASWDTTGVVASNTAQLEMIGEMVPGATIYAVTAPAPTVTLLETALETVLSPPTANLSASVRAGLANVSVVEIGWATKDLANSTWITDLEQAASRGVTIVAATGDSGDNDYSNLWPASRATFPASAGTNTVGSLAVGGLTVTLNAATSHLASEVVWNVSASDAAEDGPAGSASGISAQYLEPGYQENSTANKILDYQGRGIPDLSAVANNTLITLTVNGSVYLATNATNGGPFRFAYGTAVAAAAVAGLLSEIDHVLAAANNSALGFINPDLYALAGRAYSPPLSGPEVTSTPSGTYDSELPTAPFYDVVSGSNDVYAAGVGWDLVSGWGSLDAYNYTMYALRLPTSPVYGELAGIRDRVHLGGLAVSSNASARGVPSPHNASLQQNFFLANTLGAPVYQVQSVVLLATTAGGLWAMNFTANVTYPLSEFYPGLQVREVWSPPGGIAMKLPLTLTVTSALVPASGATPPELELSFGLPDAPTVTFETPGAAFIIGRAGYSYSWQGTTYTDGPKDGYEVTGFLAPQFVLVGSPPNRIGTFGAGTIGNVTATVEAVGGSVFVPADTGMVTSANSQAVPTALNLQFVSTSPDSYNYTYSEGQVDEGIYASQAPYYQVTFSQTGAPDGSTWYVNLSNDIVLSGTGSTSSVSIGLENGTVSWTASIDVKNWSSTPPSGSVTVSGRPVSQALVFGPSLGTVVFKAKGPEKNGFLDFFWYVNISAGPSFAGNRTAFETNLSFGKYSYTVTCANATLSPDKGSGSFVAGPTEVMITVTFGVRTYPVEFIFHLPKPAPRLTIQLGSYSDTGVFSSWTLNEPKGSYSWSITGLPFGYGAIPSHGTVEVNGPVSPIEVTISTTGWGPLGLGVAGYILVFALVGLGAVWATVYWVRRRRRRRGQRARAVRGERPRAPDADTTPTTEEPSGASARPEEPT